MFKKVISIFILALIIISSCIISVSAKTISPHDYILSDGKKVPIPKTHECIKILDYFEGYVTSSGSKGVLNNPQDMEIDSKGNIYIADTGSNALLKLDANGKLIYSLTECGGKNIDYPLGIFIDGKDDVFFSDNKNQRIVHISSDGKYIEEFTMPDSDVLSQNLAVFDPSKIGISEYTGYIYVLIGKEFMTLDATGSFRGMVGTEPVGFDLIDYLSRIFATDAQKRKILKREPLPYNNFCITDDNKIYAVSMASSNQIKRINISGENTFPEGTYGERSLSENGVMQDPIFSDIAVNSFEAITVADQNTSLLYQYNATGDLLAVFGGKGTEREEFENIAALCYDKNDNLYVLDSTMGRIQIFDTTEFMNKVHNSVQLYLDGKYDKSLNEWTTILNQISDYPVAQTIVADLYYRNGDYEKAMQMYRNAGMQDGYASVRQIIQDNFIENNFFIVAVVVIFSLAILVVVLIYMYKYSVWIEEDLYSHSLGRFKEFIGQCHLLFFHPIQGWDVLKWRRIQSPSKKERVNLIPITVLPVLLIIARYIYSKYAAFTVTGNSGQNASLLLEVAAVSVIYITLGFSIFKITTVLDGEISLYETFATISYSFLPPIFLLPIFTAISHIVTTNNMEIFNAFYILIYVWMIVLIVSGIYRINELPLIKTVGQLLICALGAVIVWALCVLLYIFAAQLVIFIEDLFNEISWRIY